MVWLCSVILVSVLILVVCQVFSIFFTSESQLPASMCFALYKIANIRKEHITNHYKHARARAHTHTYTDEPTTITTTPAAAKEQKHKIQVRRIPCLQ